MVAPNEKPDEVPTLTSKDLHAILCICVRVLKGVAIPAESLRNFPEKVKLKASYDQANKVWFLSVPQKRKRGIIKPRKRIIIPN